jgi:superfamily II DNA or RNA helicase
MRLRAYQKRVVIETLRAWEGHQRLLGVSPTGSGKTIIFSAIAHARQPAGKTLIMAHREELIDQNIDKLYKSTGLIADKEKAEFRARLSSQVVCGSVQSLMGKRRERFSPDHFATIIVDEAHHSLADSYQSVLSYFSGAKVLGVTATPDRGDKKNLGAFFEHVAFEITLPELINSGYLVKPVAKTVPLKIDLRGVRKTAGDFNAGDLEDAISPVLEAAADEILMNAYGRKILVFLPLIQTAKRFSEICNRKGFPSNYVSGECPDRKEKLEAYRRNEFRLMANSMLLTEGYDQPDVDCVVCLRPTQSRALYCQIVGRGTRVLPGVIDDKEDAQDRLQAIALSPKPDLLILDFLWMVEKHSLCKAAHLIAKDAKEAECMSRIIEANGRQSMLDLGRVQQLAQEHAREEHAREASLRRQLEQKSTKNGKLVDPIQFALSVDDQSEAEYTPADEFEAQSITDKQKAVLEQNGIDVESITCRGHASKIIDTIFNRRRLNLATPKQLKWLVKFKYPDAHTATFNDASAFLDKKFSR